MAVQSGLRDFEGKVVIVTGGASGIGAAAVKQFAERGATVVVADIQARHRQSVLDTIAAIGGKGDFVETDVTSEESVANLMQFTAQHYGRIDCAFNNAGLSGPYTPFNELTLEEWNRLIVADLTSVFLCMKHEINQMLKQGGGAIVNTASGAGFVPAPGLAHYTAAKHGVLALTKCAAKDFAAKGIRVNAICPGVTDTPMMQAFIGGDETIKQMMNDTLPFGRMGEPREIAAAAVFLCSDAASFISGESMLVDGASVCR